MLTIRSKTLFLTACIAEAVWLLVAQMLGNTILLLPCLAAFLALVAWATFRHAVLPVFLFFLPLSPLMKLMPGTISFFTLGMIATYLIYAVTASRNVRIHHFVPALVLLALTMVVKTAYGFPLDNSYFLFGMTLLLIPYIAADFSEQYDFFWLTISFGLGIIVAATSSQFLMSYANIRQYVTVMDVLGVIRQSGYFGDPNYYSAHITAALSGVLVLILNPKRKRQVFVLLVIAVLLIYCGFLSVSKSFLLVTLGMTLIWAVALLFSRGKISAKITIVLTALVGISILLSSAMFDSMLSRFIGNANMSAFTTGRTDLWANYISVLRENPMLLLFGNGYSNTLINERASHNTIIQLLFQFGIVGFSALVYWIVCFVRVLMQGVRFRWQKLVQTLVILMGAFAPWMALDYLFFDEFFIVPIYVCAAIRFLSKEEEAESPLLQEKEWA